MRKRLRNRKGFTLVEMLFALLITAMAGMLALGGITVAANSYRDILMKSQAQMVMKAYRDSIRSVLISVSPDSGFQIFEQPDYGDGKRLYLPNEKSHCAGFFDVKNDVKNGVKNGIIVFQPVNQTEHEITSDQKHKYNVSGDPIELIDYRTAKGFTAELQDFTYSGGAFRGTIQLTSNTNLSSGEPLNLEESFVVYPLNYNQ